jgi:hypothetical protein
LYLKSETLSILFQLKLYLRLGTGATSTVSTTLQILGISTFLNIVVLAGLTLQHLLSLIELKSLVKLPGPILTSLLKFWFHANRRTKDAMVETPTMVTNGSTKTTSQMRLVLFTKLVDGTMA